MSDMPEKIFAVMTDEDIRGEFGYCQVSETMPRGLRDFAKGEYILKPERGEGMTYEQLCVELDIADKRVEELEAMIYCMNIGAAISLTELTAVVDRHQARIDQRQKEFQAALNGESDE